MWILPLLLCVKRCTFLSGVTMNPPDIGKDEAKARLPMEHFKSYGSLI